MRVIFNQNWFNWFALELKANGDRGEKKSENADFTGSILEFYSNTGIALSQMCEMYTSPFSALVSQSAKWDLSYLLGMLWG